MSTDHSLQKVQFQVEEVKEVMVDNLNKSEERKEKLSDLEFRSALLQEKSKKFRKTSMRVKEEKKKELTKTRLVMAAIGVAIVLIIIIVVASMLSNSSSATPSSPQNNNLVQTTAAPHGK